MLFLCKLFAVFQKEVEEKRMKKGDPYLRTTVHVRFETDIGKEIPLDAHKEVLGRKENSRAGRQVKGAFWILRAIKKKIYLGVSGDSRFKMELLTITSYFFNRIWQGTSERTGNCHSKSDSASYTSRLEISFLEENNEHLYISCILCIMYSIIIIIINVNISLIIIF